MARKRKAKLPRPPKLKIVKVALPREGVVKIVAPKNVDAVVTTTKPGSLVVAPVPRRGGWWRSLFR